MTTIIIIVVVALVFFVTVCVATFMIWKRETELRTDSIRSIEDKLDVLGSSLMDCGGEEKIRDNAETPEYEKRETRPRPISRNRRDPFAWAKEEPDSAEEEVLESIEENDENPVTEQPVEFDEENRPQQIIRDIEALLAREKQNTQNLHENSGTYVAPELDEEPQPPWNDDGEYDEISLDFDDPVLNRLTASEEPFEQDYIFEEVPDIGEKSHQKDVGRSGKKYTAQELEMLIKE